MYNEWNEERKIERKKVVKMKERKKSEKAKERKI